MSAAPPPDRAALERLRDDFDQAARVHLRFSAVVVHELELRAEAAEALVRDLDWKPKPNHDAGAYGAYGAALASNGSRVLDRAAELFEWVPPYCATIEQLGLVPVNRYSVGLAGAVEVGWKERQYLWECQLYGPRDFEAMETARLRFEYLAEKAASLIPGVAGKGFCPESSFLIHLADRDVPLHRDARRMALTVGRSGNPAWRPVEQCDSPGWWAVGFPNVFQRARDAVRQFIDSAGPVIDPADPNPARVRCDEADRSVYLDGRRVVGEVELAVFRFFKVIAEAHPDPISFARIQDRAPGLHGKNRTRDLKDRLPAPLDGWVKSGKHGYGLKLPARKM